MTKDHYEQIKGLRGQAGYSKLRNFVIALKRNMPLAYIDTNDWSSNLKPSVYVHNKQNMFKTARYSRCSYYDAHLAVKFFNKA